MKQNFWITPVHRALWASIAFLGFFALTALPLVFRFGFHGWALGVPLIVGIAAALYVWVRFDTRPDAIARPLFGGAILFGIVGFAVGFFGPMVVAPNGSQGQLLGISVTGPVGIVLGALVGLVFGVEKSRR